MNKWLSTPENNTVFNAQIINYLSLILSCNVFGSALATIDSDIPSATVNAIIDEMTGSTNFQKHGIIEIAGKDLHITSIGTPYSTYNLSILQEKIGSESLAKLVNQIIERILWCGDDITEVLLMWHLDESHFFPEGRPFSTIKDHAHDRDMYLLTLTQNEKITTIITNLNEHTPKNQLVFMPRGTLHRTPNSPEVGSKMRIHLNFSTSRR